MLLKWREFVDDVVYGVGESTQLHRTPNADYKVRVGSGLGLRLGLRLRLGLGLGLGLRLGLRLGLG